jgi:hypothetical protein
LNVCSANGPQEAFASEISPPGLHPGFFEHFSRELSKGRVGGGDRRKNPVYFLAELAIRTVRLRTELNVSYD